MGSSPRKRSLKKTRARARKRREDLPPAEISSPETSSFPPNASLRFPFRLRRHAVLLPAVLATAIGIQVASENFHNVAAPVLLLVWSLVAGYAGGLAYYSACYFGNPQEILYLRPFDADPVISTDSLAGRGRLRTAFDGYALNAGRLMHKVSFYVGVSYGLVGLIPPPRSDVERLGMSKGFLRIEAWYLLRTIDDAHWRETIKRMIDKCRAVIVDCSHLTDHLRWEIELAIARHGKNGVIFIAEQTDAETARRAVRKLAASIPDRRNKPDPAQIIVHAPIRGRVFSGTDSRFVLELHTRLARLIRPPMSLIHLRFARWLAVRTLGMAIPLGTATAASALLWLVLRN